ncbi:MAG TPA: AraC family transcriptional regulator [Clostridiaceae bacterium]|nr:AraC family transcriptional regulator [Clostridiaceae bacterium]
MIEKFYINNPSHTDLNMYRCGIEECSPGYTWGPAVRDHYIIHYILEGCGTYIVNGKKYDLKKYDGFLICPHTVVCYRADNNNPWIYSWVGFHGIKAESYLKQANLTLDNPVFRYERDNTLEDCLKRMIETKTLSKSREIMLLGLLYEFLSCLIEYAPDNTNYRKDKKELYVKKAVEYIAMNYSRKITIDEISKYVGLDRSYLYSIFKNTISLSPQEYLIKFRIEKACELMEYSSLSICGISHSVGYEDQLLFSKTFKKVKGFSPSEFQKKIKEKKN